MAKVIQFQDYAIHCVYQIKPLGTAYKNNRGKCACNINKKCKPGNCIPWQRLRSVSQWVKSMNLKYPDYPHSVVNHHS